MTSHATEDLGLYAAGLLDPHERAEVERHLDGCAACRAALSAEESAAWALAEAAARPEPAALRSRIVEAHARRAQPVRAGFFSVLAPRVVVVGALSLAVVALAVGLVRTQSDLDREAALASQYRATLAAVAAGGRIVPLDPASGTAGRAAVVVAAGGEAYLVLEMPAPPHGKGYEAWVIRGGEALPAGVAPAGSGVVVLQLSAPTRPGDVAAVTVEVASGVSKPTSDPILVGKL